MTADNLEDAMKLVNNNSYGNGTAIFTQSGSVARKFQTKVNAGQIGINVPIPVHFPCFHLRDHVEVSVVIHTSMGNRYVLLVVLFTPTHTHLSTGEED